MIPDEDPERRPAAEQLAEAFATYLAAVPTVHVCRAAPEPERLLTIAQAAERLALGETSVKALLRSRRLTPVYPQPRALRIRSGELDEFIRGLGPAGRTPTETTGPGRATGRRAAAPRR